MDILEVGKEEERGRSRGRRLKENKENEMPAESENKEKVNGKQINDKEERESRSDMDRNNRKQRSETESGREGKRTKDEGRGEATMTKTIDITKKKKRERERRRNQWTRTLTTHKKNQLYEQTIAFGMLGNLLPNTRSSHGTIKRTSSPLISLCMAMNTI